MNERVPRKCELIIDLVSGVVMCAVILLILGVPQAVVFVTYWGVHPEMGPWQAFKGAFWLCLKYCVPFLVLGVALLLGLSGARRHGSRRWSVGLFWAVAASGAAHGADVSSSLVKIYTVRDLTVYYAPGSRRGPEQSTGSGGIPSGRNIQTKAPMVGGSNSSKDSGHE